MIHRASLTLIVCMFGVLSACGDASEASLHVVGVYEGVNGAKNEDGRSLATVNVDLPGETVTLVLTAYDPVEWDVHVTGKTKIEQIFLGGYEAAESAATVNDQPFEAVSKNSAIPYAYEQSGEKFRAIVEHLPKTLGFERVSSFRGDYDAPANGFFLTQTNTPNPRLEPDYLSRYIPSTDSLPNLSFKTVLAGIPGVYGLDLKLIEEIAQLDTGNSVRVAQSDFHFQLEANTLSFQAGAEEEPRTIAPPDELVPLWRPTWIYWNEIGQTLIVASRLSWAQNYLFEYDPDANEWALLADLERARVFSISINPETGRRMLALGQSHNSALSFAYLRENGDLISIDEFAASDLPGLTDLYDLGNSRPPGFTIDYADDKHIVFSTNGKDLDFDRDERFSPVRKRIYLYNTQTTKLDLIYYQGMKSQL